MGVKTTLEIGVDSSQASASVEEINKGLTDADKAAGKLGNSIDDVKQGLNDTKDDAGKVGTNLEKSAEKGGKSFKAMAASLGKSLGIIGLIAGAISVVKDALAGNQKVVDFFSTAIGTLSDMVRDFFNFVTDNAGQVVDFFKAIFDDPMASIEKLGQAIKENLVERFESFGKTLGLIGKAVAQFFSGEFTQSWETLKEAGKESIDVLTGVNNTVDKVGEAVSNAAEAIGEYVKKTWDANAALVDLQNNAKIAAAQAARLAEQYDRSAELLRQTRDDERKSIEDRIKANNQLKDVLDKQEEAELAAANAQVVAAQATYNHNKTIDNQVALTQALANADGVRAKVAGLRSEQQMNDLALNKEMNELLKAQSEAYADLDVNAQRFAADNIKDERARLDAQRAVLEQEKQIQLERLQGEIDKHAQGTQARLDAEIAYNQKKQEIDQGLEANSIAKADAEIARINEMNSIRVGLIQGGTQMQLAALELEYQQKAALHKGDSEYLILLEEEKQKKMLEIKNAARQKDLQMASDVLGALTALNNAFPANTLKNAKKSFKINKALQLAQAGINGTQSVMSVLADPTLVGPARWIAAATAGITAAANVAKIAKTKFDESQFQTEKPEVPTAPSGASSGGSMSAPSLDLSFLNNQATQAQPLQAYVLSTHVSTSLQADEKIQEQARIK